MAQWVKNLPAMQKTQEMQIGSQGGEDALEEEDGNPLQYSCLKYSMDRGAWLGYSTKGCKEPDTAE